MTRKATDPPGDGDRRPLQAPRHRHRPGRGDLRRVPRQPAASHANGWPARSASEDELLFPDDQQRQRRHDLDSMVDRCSSLDDEEQREIAAIRARYADIRPHVTAAAVVFALTPEDASGRQDPAMNGRTDPAPSGAELHRAWLELVDTDGPFLAVPVLKRAWPQGMPQPDGKRARRAAGTPGPRSRRPGTGGTATATTRPPGGLPRRRGTPGWTWSCATSSAGRPPTSRADAAATANPTAAQALPRRSTRPTTRSPSAPTGALVHGDTTGALVLVIDPVDSLRDPLADGWAASPIDRMEDCCCGRPTSRSAWSPTGAGGRSSAPARRPWSRPASSSALTWIEDPGHPERVHRAAASPPARSAARPRTG